MNILQPPVRVEQTPRTWLDPVREVATGVLDPDYWRGMVDNRDVYLQDIRRGLHRGIPSALAGTAGDIQQAAQQSNLGLGAQALLSLTGNTPLFGVVGPPLMTRDEAADRFVDMGWIPQATGRTGERIAEGALSDLLLGTGIDGRRYIARGAGDILSAGKRAGTSALDTLGELQWLEGGGNPLRVPSSQRGAIGEDINAPRFQFGEPDEMGFRLVSEDVVSMPSFPRKGTAEQMRAALGQGRKGGLHPKVSAEIGGRRLVREELENLGVMKFLDQQEAAGQPVTQEDLLAVIQANKYKYELDENVLDEDVYGGEFVGRTDYEPIDYDNAYNEGYRNNEDRIDDLVYTEMEDIESSGKKLGELNDRIASLERQQVPREAGQLDLLSGYSGHVQRYETQQLKEAKAQKDAILRDYEARFPDSPMLSKAEIVTRMEDREDYDPNDALNIEDELRDWAEKKDRAAYSENPLEKATLLDRDGEEVAHAVGNDEEGYHIWSDGEYRDHVDTWGDNNPSIERRLIGHAHEQGIDQRLYSQTAEFRDYLAEDNPIEIIEMGEISEPEEYREIPIYLSNTPRQEAVGEHFPKNVGGRSMGSPYHIRVTERTWEKPNGEEERILFADELQSDWGQAGSGRKEFPAAKVKQDKEEMLELMRQMDEYDRGPYATKPRYKLMDAEWSDPKETDKLFKLGAQKWDKPEVKAAYDKIFSMSRELSRRLEETGLVSRTWEKNMFNESAVPDSYILEASDTQLVATAPLVEGEWVQHAVKRAISEMINNNKDRLVFTSGRNQTKLYNNTERAKGLTQFYDKTLKNTVKQVMKNVDKDAVEILEAEAGDEESLKHISIKNTEKLRDFLSGKGGRPKGWGMYGVALPAPIAASFMSGQQETQQNSPLSP